MLARQRKDVAKSIKTLLVMLQSMRDQQVTITLRNDHIVTGTIISVDSNMNIQLKNALVGPDPFYQTAQSTRPEETKKPVPDDPQQTQTNTHEVDKEMLTLSEDSREGYHDDETKPVSSESDDDDDPQDEKAFDFFVVKGTRVRQVDIPEDFDVLAGTKQEIERIRNRRRQWSKRDIVKDSGKS